MNKVELQPKSIRFDSHFITQKTEIYNKYITVISIYALNNRNITFIKAKTGGDARSHRKKNSLIVEEHTVPLLVQVRYSRQ